MYLPSGINSNCLQGIMNRHTVLWSINGVFVISVRESQRSWDWRTVEEGLGNLGGPGEYSNECHALCPPKVVSSGLCALRQRYAQCMIWRRSTDGRRKRTERGSSSPPLLYRPQCTGLDARFDDAGHQDPWTHSKPINFAKWTATVHNCFF